MAEGVHRYMAVEVHYYMAEGVHYYKAEEVAAVERKVPGWEVPGGLAETEAGRVESSLGQMGCLVGNSVVAQSSGILESH